MAGKYQAYPDYKYSGIDLLGDIPASWSWSRHKYIARFQKGKNPEVLLDTPNEGSIRYLSMDYLRGNSDASFADIERSSYVSKKDQVLIVWDGSNAGEFVKGQEGIVSSTMAASELLSDINHGFYWNSCVCLEPEMRKHANGMGIPHVNGNELKNALILLPSKEEQEKITNFLDHETAKIDSLIEKQQQLIKLLKEKRQAVVSHAVTNGLNPNVPMRDSGVEWLGEVPAHWKVGRLKNVLNIRNGKDYKDVEVESGGYPVYGSGGIFKRSSTYLYDGKSVLFGRKGTVDKPLLVSGKFWTVDTMFYSEISEYAFAEYVYYQATMFPFNLLSTNTALPSMTQEDLLGLGFVIPPKDEQSNIVKFVERKCEQFDYLTQKAELAIELMQERRTALISDAVTGKIDIRNWQAPNIVK